jgi:hypothetical protein
MDEGWRLRRLIYRHLADTGAAPTTIMLERWAGGPATASRLLGELQQRHAVVVDDSGRIRMALPFSGVATEHRVVAGKRSWFANCAWDALAIPVALGIDSVIESPYLDDGRPVQLAVVHGELTPAEGFVHFAIPARHWWDDIVQT